MTHARSSIELLESRRLLSAGGTDYSFGDLGTAPLTFSSGATGGDVTVSASGAMYGVRRVGSGAEVRKLMPDGSVDTTFGTTIGKTTIDSFEPTKIAVDSATGRIAVIGFNPLNPSSTGIGVFVLAPGGNLDSTFGNDGFFQLSTNTDLAVNTLGFQPDGKLLIAQTDSTSSNAVLTRITADGHIDTGFGANGTLTLTDAGPIKRLVFAGGKIDFVSSINFNNDFVSKHEMTVGRLKDNGTYDTTFSEDGHLIIEFASDGNGSDLVRAPDGHLFVAYFNNLIGATNEFGNHIIELTASGTKLSRNFDVTGVGSITTLAVQSDDKLLTLYSDNVSPTIPDTFHIARLNEDGSRDLRWGYRGSANVGGLPFELFLDPSDRPLTTSSRPNEAFTLTRYEGGSGRIQAPEGQAVVDQRVLDVAGTPGGDTITLTQDGTTIHVVINAPTTFNFTTTAFDSIIVHSGAGDDVVTIGSGVMGTYVLGGSGFDTLRGGDFNDTLTGGDDNDEIFGGAGSDRLNGSGGNDTLSGDSGNDRLYGGSASDQLFGGSGADHLFGEAGKDYLKGDKGADRLDGGSGNDTATSDDEDMLIAIEG